MIAWSWQDLGGRTEKEHVVTGYDGETSVLVCGMRFDPEPKRGRKKKRPCLACLRSLRLHAEMVEGLFLTERTAVDRPMSSLEKN